MKNEHGFSILELLIVVAVVTLIAAMAIPNLKKARQSASSASAVQSLRTVTTAEQMYRQKYQVYATLAQLAPEGTLDSTLGVGTKSSYLFTITLAADQLHYTCTANPIEDISTMTYYFTDESAVIRYNYGAVADVTSPPIPR
jgi:prepilin-type N-terminal cleavage/methylation domain